MSIELKSVKAIKSLKQGIEATTGETYTDLTKAVQGLKDGYGKGNSNPINGRIYDLTFPQSSGWILLTELDEETLSHINDPTFMVVFRNIDEYSYAFYAASSFIVSNTPCGEINGFSVYGSCDRQSGDTLHSMGYIYYPANNTGTDESIGNGAYTSFGTFRVTDGKYYLKPSDGFIRGGKYRLIITW